MSLILLMFSFFLNSCVKSNNTQHTKNTLASLSVYGNLPSFKGITDSEKEIDEKSLKDKVSIISFFFSSCGDVCPKLNAVKSSIVKTYQSDKLRFLSVTVDPLNDTPSQLNNHRNVMGFSDKRWLFVRMHSDTILESFMNGMLIGYAENPQNHTARMILVDSKSRIRGYFDALDRKQIDSLKSILDKVR
ncbi:MAG: SCO family protein [Candidatus Kapaibacteriota bacterium]